MSEFTAYAIVLRAVQSLNKVGSWTGKTHVIKSLFIASSKVELPFQFVLFKHGPYSFDANDAIEFMSAVKMLELTSTPPYGVKLKPGQIERIIETDVDPKVLEAVDEAAKAVGSCDVKELEAFATSLWVSEKQDPADNTDWFTGVKKLKPHLDDAMIVKAIERARAWDEVRVP